MAVVMAYTVWSKIVMTYKLWCDCDGEYSLCKDCDEIDDGAFDEVQL